MFVPRTFFSSRCHHHCQSSHQALLDAHKLFKNTLPDAEAEVQGTISLAQEVDRICSEYKLMIDIENPFTTIQPKV